MQNADKFNGIAGIRNPIKKKSGAWTFIFTWLVMLVVISSLGYGLLKIGSGNIERYCLIHAHEGRLDCMFSENF